MHNLVSVTCTTQNQETKINQEESRVGSGLQIRRTFSSGEKYDVFPPLKNMNKNFRIMTDPILNRPFLSEVITWATASPRYSSLHQVNFPSGALAANGLAIQSFQIAALYRTKACVRISLTGTIAHQGLLLAAVRPMTTNTISGPFAINSLLTGPHAFLSANEATSVCIEIPFMSSSQLLPTQMTGAFVTTFKSENVSFAGADYAEIVLYVVNPLTVATGTSTSLSVVIETEFKDMELYVPRNNTISWTAQSSYGKIATGVFDGIANGAKSTAVDIIDALRSSLRSYTGLHNPNDHTLTDKMLMTLRNTPNYVDSTTRYAKLDPYSQFDRINSDFRFLTKEDEMLVANIVQKPQYVGTFSISTSDPSGRMLFSRPISPNQGYSGIKSSTPVGSTVTVCNNIEHLYNATRSWSGSLKIHIQSVMSAKHSVKLQVSKYYSPSLNVIAAAGTPNMYSLSGGMTELIEFSQGGQIITIDLPYCAQLRSLFNTKDLRANAVQHGMYYIHLAQPLVIGDNVPTTAEFNVYISCGEDFTFYGYATDSFLSGGTVLRFEQELPLSNHFNIVAENSENILDLYSRHFSHVPLEKFQLLNSNHFKQDGDLFVSLIVPKGSIIYGSYTSKIRSMDFWPEINSNLEFYKTFGLDFPNRSKFLKDWPPVEEFAEDNFIGKFQEKFSVPLQSLSNFENLKDFKNFQKWYKDQINSVSVSDAQFKFMYSDLQKVLKPYDSDVFNKSTKFLAQSAQVMNEGSSQEVLIDSSKPAVVKDDDYSDLLKPLVSIRDIIRRITPASALVKWDNSATAAVTLKNIIFPFGSLTPQAGANFSSTNIISFMYYGQDSGRKFKVIASGSNAGNLSYNPPALSYNGTNLVQTSALAPTTATYLPYDMLTTNSSIPFSELCDQWSIKGTPVTKEGTSYCVYEGIIPNVNPAEYISNPGSNASNSVVPSASLGELIFSVPNASNSAEGESGVVRLLTGFTDESRLGFHMFAPVVTLNLTAAAPYSLLSCANPVTLTATNSIVYTSVPAYAYYSTLNTTYN